MVRIRFANVARNAGHEMLRDPALQVDDPFADFLITIDGAEAVLHVPMAGADPYETESFVREAKRRCAEHIQELAHLTRSWI